MGGKGRTTINQPDPIDPGQAMGEYLFGKGFQSYGGVTDPRLQERLIGAEERFRPRYAALELQDIATFAYGTEGGVGSDAYNRKKAEVDALKAARGKIQGGDFDQGATIDAIMGERPADLKSWRGGAPSMVKRRQRKAEQEDYDRRKKALEQNLKGTSSVAELDAKIAMAEADLQSIASSPEGTPGLFSLLEESGRRASAMQRESLQLQREADVGALQEFAPQVVEAYREADPYSTEMAELQSQQARDLYAESRGQLSPERARLAEQAARSAGIARGRILDSSSMAQELLSREEVRSGLRAEARQAGQMSFGLNRALAGDVGMTILGRPSAGLALGGNVLGQAQAQAAGPMGPQLFDPNVGINMALQQRSQDMSLLGAQAQANATRSAGRGSMLGSIGGAFMGGIFN